MIINIILQSTKSYEDKDNIMHELEKHGGICDCQASRDTFVYAASAERTGLDKVTEILGDIVLRPRITDNEVNIAKQTIEFELETLASRPEQDLILTDMIHAVSFFFLICY